MKLINVLRFVLTSIILFHNFGFAQKTIQINWQKDITYLREKLPEQHKNLFFKTNRDTFSNRLQRIMNEEVSSGADDVTIALQIQEVIAAMGDAHTNTGYEKLLNDQHRFPFRIFWYADGPRITRVSEDYKKLMGSLVLEINHRPIEEVMNKLSALVSVDNHQALMDDVPELVSSGDILHYFNIASTDSVLLTIEKTPGNKECTWVFSKGRKQFDELEIYSPKPVLYLQNATKLFWTNYNPADSILYFQYNSCWGREMEKAYGNKKRADRFPAFIDTTNYILNQIDSGLVKKLIIDFRFNGGGASQQGSRFSGQIARNERINQTGKLFVVIGRKTFSSAILNVMDFKKATHAILVGEPTGEKPNHYGEVRKFVLPSSGIPVYYSTRYFYVDAGDYDAVYPDIETSLTFESLMSGMDPVYESVRLWK